jgi:2-hydroxychromene-2-carboxylate isomerase
MSRQVEFFFDVGSPTFFVGDEIFFGQDRLEFVAEELDAQSR